MKVALVTDYLNVYGGGERIVESLLEIYPEADVFTSFYDSSKFSPMSLIHKVTIRSAFNFKGFNLLGLNPIRFLVSLFPKHFTFIFPYFFERLNLSAYDLVISVGTIWCKGVKIDPGRQKHIFYCLTPPRFLYGYASETSRRNVWYYRPFTTLIDHWLRIWDFNAAQNPDEIFVISNEVKRRVRKFYRRESKVIYPPVDVPASPARPRLAGLQGVALQGDRGYFLVVSRLAAYKGIDVAIKACNQLKLPLKIVGTGKEENRLKELSKVTLDSAVEFLGFRSDEELAGLYQNCRAVIFPAADEDFGLVPVEANAHGVPVIAHRSGGVLETMIEGRTAIFYSENTADSLARALQHYVVVKWSKEACVENAQRFSKEKFQKEFRDFVDQSPPEKNPTG